MRGVFKLTAELLCAELRLSTASAPLHQNPPPWILVRAGRNSRGSTRQQCGCCCKRRDTLLEWEALGMISLQLQTHCSVGSDRALAYAMCWTCRERYPRPAKHVYGVRPGREESGAGRRKRNYPRGGKSGCAYAFQCAGVRRRSVPRPAKSSSPGAGCLARGSSASSALLLPMVLESAGGAARVHEVQTTSTILCTASVARRTSSNGMRTNRVSETAKHHLR